MLIYCRFALVFISFILLGCSGSDDNTEEVNLPPVIELQAPSSALSLEQVTITAQVTDPENDTVSLLWHLSSDAGLDMEVVDVNELSYQIPLTSVDTAYTVTLVATDSHGNQASESSTFTVPALDVSFTQPFDAISQRYVDTEANLLNIASTDIIYGWGISQYPLTIIAPNRVRFFAAKELTEEYDPNAEPERIRGEGITEDLLLTLTVSDGSTSIDFDKTIIVQPIQKLTSWPEHIVSAEMQATITAATINSLEVIDNCLSRENTVKNYFDYNQNGVDDVFCTYSDTLYFYLSDIDSAGKTIYTESVVIENQVLTEYSELIDLDKNGIPELVLAVGPGYVGTLISLTYNSSSHSFDEKELIDIGYSAKDYRLTEANGILSMAIRIDGQQISTGLATDYIKALIFDAKGEELKKTDEFEVVECLDCVLVTLAVGDLSGQGVDELLIENRESSIYGPSNFHNRVSTISGDYTKLSAFPMFFREVYQEDIHDDGTLEWVGVTETYKDVGIFIPDYKLHLTLDQEGEPNTEVLESYYSDLFFNYGSESYAADLNQDEQLDEFTKLSYYEEDYYQKDRFYSYTLAGSDKRVLISTESYDTIRDDFIGLEDMNNNGYLDLKFGQVSENNIETVTSWLENVEGYPFE
ncbi:hypothetical protein Ssed_3893 [Shewanella sediminis HAW-EB3]|uniref:Uncharacterized protein n=1 Tax=Shewanella sediminis (strain HAW-EB3) TaxID=425104 RepID=A8G074_SHESH|nr:VCBS repeat-containing protein [Shewanella sediminis]ABV38497.1 hypothetical protein Ssed_3893 [Shewanella sediminis HAW-EB3]